MFIVISVHPTDKDCCDSGKKKSFKFLNKLIYFNLSFSLKANCSEANFHRIKKITIDINAGYDRKLYIH